MGQCTACNAWNTLVEELLGKRLPPSLELIQKGRKNTKARPLALSDISNSNKTRRASGIQEFDRVLGGGIVRGSAVLISGAPGIGKSTLVK